MMTYYKMTGVLTPACGTLCKEGHTIYYGVSSKSWLDVYMIRIRTLEKFGLRNIRPHYMLDDKEIPAIKMALLLMSGKVKVGDVHDIHQFREPVYVTGTLPHLWTPRPYGKRA